jgi:hypothetical protein
LESGSATRRYVIWTVLIFVVLLPFVLIDGPAAGWLRDLGLLDRDERFTELYFPDRRALPAAVAPGAPIAFDIALRNREGGPTSYRWKAVVTTGGTDVDLARGRARIDDGEVRRVPVDGPAPEPAGPAVVRVTLVGRTETIDFPVSIAPVADVAPPPSA